MTAPNYHQRHLLIYGWIKRNHTDTIPLDICKIIEYLYHYVRLRPRKTRNEPNFLQLRRECSRQGLLITGTKRQLLNRLNQNMKRTEMKIKQRNSRYYHWSKRLREAVELFGDYNYDIDPPFYTGISCVMEMQSFSIRLCAPTSTSVQMEVAVKFSGSNGIIMQLTTKGIMTGTAQFVRGFDVSWLSNFKEEDERYQYLLYTVYLYTFLLLFIQTVLWRILLFGDRVNQINE